MMTLNSEVDVIELMNKRLPSYAVKCLLVAGFDATDAICAMEIGDAFGLEPSNYVFDQSKMRTHFTQSLEKKLIEPFPTLKEKRTTLSSTVIYVEVHCYCRRPYNGQRMVQCNGDCHQWYHLECIKTAAAVRRKQKWFCRNCTK